MKKINLFSLTISAFSIFLICCKGSIEPIPSLKQKIAFVSYRDDNYEIYTMDHDGSDQLNLTKNPSADVEPVYSPDGSKIAFVSSRDGVGNIYMMNHDGSEQIKITNNHIYSNSPLFSPDGSQIIFVSREGRDSLGNIHSDIYSIDTDGSNQKNLTNNPSQNYKPQYSSDGSKIAFISERTGNSEIYIMGIDGINQKNITNTGSNVQDYKFSPDGSKIVFSLLKIGVSLDTYIINSDGSDIIKLTDNISSHDGVFSPDGNKIAFVAREQNAYDIYIMKIDGSNQINLTQNPKGGDFNPQFSFDGSQILFGSNRDPGVIGGVMNTEIYIMDVDGNNQKNLSTNPSIDENPVYQPQIR